MSSDTLSLISRYSIAVADMAGVVMVCHVMSHVIVKCSGWSGVGVYMCMHTATI